MAKDKTKLTPREPIWLKWRWEIQFRDMLCGALPATPDKIEQWVKTSKPLKELLEVEKIKIIAEHVEQVGGLTEEKQDELTDEKVQRVLTVFARDEVGLYLESRCLRGCFKEASTTSGLMLENRGGSGKIGLRQTIQHGFALHNDPYNPKGAIYIVKDGKVVSEPEEVRQSVCHPGGPTGPRACLKACEVVHRPTMAFTTAFLNNGLFPTIEDWQDLMDYYREVIGENGAGKDRSQTRGQFDVTKLDFLGL